MPDRTHKARATHNQRIFRSVNERLQELQPRFGYFTERSSWICECADMACVEHVSMTLPEYEWVRADPRHFLVRPGHVDTDAAVIVDAGRFAVLQAREPLRRKPRELLYYYRLGPEPGFDYVSELVAEWVGFTPEEHYADPALGSKIVHAEDAALLGAILARPELGPMRIRWSARDGRLLVTEHRIVPVLEDDGDPIAVAGRATLVGETTESDAAAA